MTNRRTFLKQTSLLAIAPATAILARGQSSGSEVIAETAFGGDRMLTGRDRQCHALPQPIGHVPITPAMAGPARARRHCRLVVVLSGAQPAQPGERLGQNIFALAER